VDYLFSLLERLRSNEESAGALDHRGEQEVASRCAGRVKIDRELRGGVWDAGAAAGRSWWARADGIDGEVLRLPWGVRHGGPFNFRNGAVLVPALRGGGGDTFVVKPSERTR
jgi:hypothetical protein